MGAKLSWPCVTQPYKRRLDKDSENDKDVGDDKDGNKLKESDLVSHHLTSPSALAVISSLHDLLAVHTVSFGYDDSDDIWWLCMQANLELSYFDAFDGRDHLLNRPGQYGKDQNQSQPEVSRLSNPFVNSELSSKTLFKVHLL